MMFFPVTFLGMELVLFDGILHIQFSLNQFQIIHCYYLFLEVIRAGAETYFPVQIQNYSMLLLFLMIDIVSVHTKVKTYIV